MGSHVLNLVLFATLVSVVFAMLLRDTASERVRFGLLAFAGFVASALVVGWVMFPFPD